MKFINLVLINSEVWHPVNENNLKDLKKADKSLFRIFLESPSTTPVEFLYLETGTIPILNVLKCRRIKYLHYILWYDENEMLP